MSDRRKYLILMGAIVAALAGAVLLAVPGSPIYQKPPSASTSRAASRSCSRRCRRRATSSPPRTSTGRSRSCRTAINKLGVSEPEIRKQGSNQIVIQLAGVHDAAAAAKLIGKTAQLSSSTSRPTSSVRRST